MSNSIQAYERLDDALIREVRALEVDCREQDGEREPMYLDVSLNFDSGMKSFFLLYDGGRLASVLVIFAPTHEQAEISALTRPESRRKGYFASLFQAAEAELVRRGVPEVLLVCDRRSDDGFEAVSALGARLEHTEYTLGFEGGRPAARETARLALRRCVPEDETALAGLSHAIFGDSEDEARARAHRDITAADREQYLAVIDGAAAGMVAVGHHDTGSSVYGLGLLAEHRGKGLGRELLGQVLTGLLDRGITDITIEVDSHNEGPHALYRSLGFADRSVIDYYRYPLAESKEPRP